MGGENKETTSAALKYLNFLSRSLYNTMAKKTLSAVDLWWNIAIKGRVFSAKCISAVGSNLSAVCSVLLFLLKACWQVRGQMETALGSPGASQKQSDFCGPQKFLLSPSVWQWILHFLKQISAKMTERASFTLKLRPGKKHEHLSEVGDFKQRDSPLKEERRNNRNTETRWATHNKVRETWPARLQRRLASL